MKRLIIAIAYVVVMHLVNAVGFADMPRLPQPMRFSDLKGYMTALQLSAEQSRAVEIRYEEYVDEYERLRSEMIEVAVQFPHHGSSEEEFIRRLPAFVARVRSMDDALFAQIESLLTDAQRRMLPRVRDDRERLLYGRMDAVARFAGEVINLRDLLESLHPPADTLDAVTPAMVTYEQRLTDALRGVYHAAMRVCVSNQDGAADALIERVNSLRALQRRAYAEIANLLPESMRRQWRDAFFQRCYGLAVGSAEVWVIAQCEAALAMPELTDDARQRIERMLADAQKLYDTTVTELADMLDQQAIAIAPPGGARGNPEFYDALNGARQRTTEQSFEMRKQLSAILGEERFGHVKDLMYQPRSLTRATQRLSCGIVARTELLIAESDSPRVPGWRGDPLFAMPFGHADVEDTLKALRVGELERAAILGLHREYMEKLDKDLEQPRQQRTMILFQPRRPGEDAADPDRRVHEVEQLRASVRAIIEAADAQLFQDVLLMVGLEEDDPAWLRLRRARQRSMISLDLPFHPPPDASRSAEIDLMWVIMREVGLAFDPQLDKAASEYEGRLHELLQARFDAYREYTLEELHRRLGGPAMFTNESHQRWRERTEDLHRRHAAIAELNALYVKKISDHVPPEVAAAVLDTYQRRAYPRVFEDRSDVRQTISAALSLPDLSTEQRARLNALQHQHVVGYAGLQQRLIDTCAMMPVELPGIGTYLHPERAASEERFVQHWAQASDMRAALNRRTWRELKLMLTSLQLTQLPLPEAD